MSRAYKCDRCGALYESYEGENRDDVLKPTKVMFRCTTKDRHYYDTQLFVPEMHERNLRNHELG